MILETLLMASALFNTEQITSSVYQKDMLNAGTYKIRVHANSVITEANSDYGNCNIAGQDAVCTIQVDNPVEKTFLSTIKLQKRADEHYVIDYSASDEAVKPSPSIIDTDALKGTSNTNATSTTVKPVDKQKVATKKTGNEILYILLMVAIFIFSAKRIEKAIIKK